MKVFVIDISGRVTNYDIALYNSLVKCIPDNEVKLIMADVPKTKRDNNIINLINLIPPRYKCSENTIKRFFKAIEVILNYIYIIFYCKYHHPDIIHFQWLPFLEICSLEMPILQTIRILNPNCKMILTIHNVYPHNFNDVKKQKYKQRFLKISKLFNGFIVHTKQSKHEVVDIFNINEKAVRVVHHGIFEPNLNGLSSERTKSKEYRLISYGLQDSYKGTDILLDAISLLPKEFKDKVELSIIGRGNASFISILKEKGKNLNVKWKLYFVDDKTLFQDISDSDAIVLPYRSISQSGVLLLAMYFNKPIICSDLPAFKETLEGYPEELFFKSGDPASLKEIIMQQLSKGVDKKILLSSLEHLRSKYSWDMAGELTVDAYLNI